MVYLNIKMVKNALGFQGKTLIPRGLSKMNEIVVKEVGDEENELIKPSKSKE